MRFSPEPVIGPKRVLLEVEVEIIRDRDRTVAMSCGCGPGFSERLRATVQTQSSRTLSDNVTFDAVGWNSGWAKLEGNLDVLPADDERAIAVVCCHRRE